MKDKYSIEEICVADADALAHIDNLVELLCWRAYAGDSIEKANDFVKKKIEKSYNKMSGQSRKLFKDKYENVMRILY